MLNRIRNIVGRKQSPLKSIVGYGGLSGSSVYPLGFFPNDNRDLEFSKVGAAASFCFVPEVNNAISSIVGGIESLPWDIKKYPKGIRRENGRAVEGDILASDDDLQNRHIFQRALANFQRENNFSLLGTIATDYTLYGECALEIATNSYSRNPVVEWLNPLGLQVYALRQIEWFRFGWNTTYVQYDPDEVAYLHNRNPFNDFIGFPIVLAVLDKINISRNTDRFLRDYFLNNARPGLIIMPPDTDANMSDTDYENLKRHIRENLKGVGGQYNTLIAQHRIDAVPLEQPDLVRNSQLSREQSDAIYEKFSVPRAMRGNTSATPYKDGDETTRRFYLDAVLPLAKIIQKFINTELMPYFDRTAGLEVFEFDTSAFDMVTEADMQEAQVIEIQLRSGLIDLYTASQKQEIPADERLKGLYMIEGVPVPIEQLATYWEKKLLIAPSEYNTGLVTGEPLPEPVPADEVIPTEDGGAPVSDEYIDDAITDSPTPTAQPLDALVNKSHEHSHAWHSLYDDNPSEDAIDERIKTALNTWKTYALRRYGTTKSSEMFTPNPKIVTLPPYLRHAMIDALDTCASHDDVRKAFAAILDNPHVKTIQTYGRALREIALAQWRGDYTPSEARANLDKRIATSLEEAFVDGVKQGGLTRDDLDGNDWNELTKAINEETTHTRTLVDWIEANSRSEGGKQRDIYARVDRWVARYEQVQKLGYVLASKTKKLKWKYDPRKEHCRSCKVLNGIVKTGDFWVKANIQPQSTRLECYGLECGCEFEETDEPVTKGRLPRLYLRD